MFSARSAVMVIWVLSTAIAEIKAGKAHKFLRQPFPATVKLGGTVGLSCAVRNMQTSVQWSVDNYALSAIDKDPRLSIQGNKTLGEYNLQITNAQLMDDGNYRCLVYPNRSQGLQLLRSRSAYLNVTVPPRDVRWESVYPGVIDVRLSESVAIICTARDAKPAAKIRWRVDGRAYDGYVSAELSPGSHAKLTSSLSSITLKPSKMENGSFVECVIEHPALDRPISRKATLNVLYPSDPPKISGFREKPIQSGQRLDVSCETVGGNPRANMTWLMGDEIIQRDYELTGTGSRSSLSYRVRRQDNGKFITCRADTPALDAPMDASFKLTVYYPPKGVIIKREPEDGSRENGVMKFTCHFADSNPKASLTWFFNDVELPRQWSVNVGTTPYMIHSFDVGKFSARTTLILTTVRREDADLTVTCRASIPKIDFTAEAQSRPVVIYPPRIVNVSVLEPTAPLTIPFETESAANLSRESFYKAGDVIMLKCQAQGGSPPPHLGWFLNGVPVSDDDSSTVSAPQLNRDVFGAVYSDVTVTVTFEFTLRPSHNGATVSCVAKHPGLKTPISDEKYLKVAFPPAGLSIVEFPSSSIAGKPTSLTCTTFSSFPLAKISWLRNNVKLPAHLSTNLPTVGGKLGGLIASNRLQFTPSQEDDMSSYVCRAEVEILQDVVIKLHTLSVQYPPAFYFTTENQATFNATEGDSFIDIVVHTRANPSNMRFTWFLNKLALTKDWRFVWTEEEEGLRINNPQREDGGLYTLRASNSIGSAEQTITLNVFYPPSIIRISGAGKIPMERDLVQLRCDFKSHPLTPAHVKWNKKIPGKGRSKYDVETYAEHSILTLTNLTAADRGRYQCMVDNGVGHGDSQELNLKLLYAPVFNHTTPSVVVVSSGDDNGHNFSTAELRCLAYSSPVATIMWTEDGHSINASDDERYSVQQDLVSDDAIQSILKVNITSPNVSTQKVALPVFSCIATNNRGKLVKRVRLVWGGPPDPPSGLHAYNVTDSSVHLTWKQGFDGGAQQRFIIQYRSKTNSTQAGFREVISKSNMGSVDALEQNQKYLFRVIAKNRNGESAPSETISVTMDSWWQNSTGMVSKEAHFAVLAVIAVVAFAFVIGVTVIAFRRCKISKHSYRPKPIESDCKSLTLQDSNLSSRRSSDLHYAIKRLVKETDLDEAQSESNNNTSLIREEDQQPNSFDERPMNLLQQAVEPYESYNLMTRSRRSYSRNPDGQYQENSIQNNFWRRHTFDHVRCSLEPCRDGRASAQQRLCAASTASTGTILYNFVSRPPDGHATSLLLEPDCAAGIFSSVPDCAPEFQEELSKTLENVKPCDDDSGCSGVHCDESPKSFSPPGSLASCLSEEEIFLKV